MTTTNSITIDLPLAPGCNINAAVGLCRVDDVSKSAPVVGVRCACAYPLEKRMHSSVTWHQQLL